MNDSDLFIKTWKKSYPNDKKKKCDKKESILIKMRGRKRKFPDLYTIPSLSSEDDSGDPSESREQYDRHGDQYGAPLELRDEADVNHNAHGNHEENLEENDVHDAHYAGGFEVHGEGGVEVHGEPRILDGVFDENNGKNNFLFFVNIFVPKKKT